MKTFKFPEIEIDGKKYNHIDVRKPTFMEKYVPQKKWKSVNPTPEELIDYQTQVACKVTGLPVETFYQLPADVAEQIIEYFMN
ncbi:phage tail assembly protein (plasmid) [Komagataeibacter medellinensis]|uniref:Phage tail assembly protein n=1 Tax=Komagataeibacter medellinensis TaxID=1177712 RepID=A0ABQ6VVW6_9PROT|nr:phage tail assembly protein [Komagataeibacter medellinensis]KAB8122218.1 phage tail assembly protein [Komagataeibacter medellinensis]